jgi:hypothetical protein
MVSAFFCRFISRIRKGELKMRKIISAVILVFISSQPHASPCLHQNKLFELDQAYETALLQRDIKSLDKLLADDYYWVHNLASTKENKAQLFARLASPDKETKARTSHDLTSRKLANTVVVEGLSSVEKWNPDGTTFRTSRYQIMRTYVAINGKCQLLAVQSMKVWSSSEE